MKVLTQKQKVRRAFWLEIACVLLISLFLALITVWNRFKPFDPWLEFAIGGLAFAIIVLLIIILRAIWKLGLKSVLATKLKAFIARAATFIIYVSDKYRLFGRRGNVVSGKTTVSFDYSVFETRKIKQKPFKPPR